MSQQGLAYVFQEDDAKSGDGTMSATLVDYGASFTPTCNAGAGTHQFALGSQTCQDGKYENLNALLEENA